MGLIKKKTAIRGTEGGVKYVCDVCSADITATVSAASNTNSPNAASAPRPDIETHNYSSRFMETTVLT
jgi:hypothetical protein